MGIRVRVFFPRDKDGRIRKPHFTWGGCTVVQDDPPYEVAGWMYEIWITWVLIQLSWTRKGEV